MAGPQPTTTDIYTRFNLPPPPKPTIFSSRPNSAFFEPHAQYNSEGAARLPDFQSVDEVSDFLYRIVAFPRPQASVNLLPFLAAYLILLEIGIPFLIAHKIRKRSWWLFRFSPRRQGHVLIPNVHNVWTLCVSVYGWILIGLALSMFVHYRSHTPLPHRGLILSLLWVPLCFAASYQTWAILYAEVGSGGTDGTMGYHWWRMGGCPAWILNAFNLSVPLIASSLCVGPGIIADRYYEAGRRGWHQWQADYAPHVANGHGLVTTSDHLSRQMLVDAQEVWKNQLLGSFYTTISFLTWMAALTVIGGGQIFAAWRLIFKLHQHLRNNPETSFLPRLPWRVSLVQWARGLFGGKEHRRRRPARGKMHWRWNCALHRRRANVHHDGSQSAGALLAVHPAFATHSDSDRLCTVIEEDEEQASRAFFPPVRTSQVPARIPQRRAEKVLTYFICEWVGPVTVTLGALSFAGNIIFVCRNTFPSMEAGHPERMDGPAWMSLTIVCLILSTTTAISVGHSFFEASFAVLVHHGLRRQMGTGGGNDAVGGENLAAAALSGDGEDGPGLGERVHSPYAQVNSNHGG
ncbi:hypothetical protein V8E36_000864 [Tilletia maclaganii]